MRTGIIAALPGELQPLVRGWEKMPVARGSGIAMWMRERDGDEDVAVCAGMGAAAARRAFIAAEFAGSLDVVLSVGWAGALTDASTLSPVMTEVIDAQTGERFELATHTPKQRLVTAVQIADGREKRRLADAYGAVAVDMEAATVARLAQMRGIPVFCFKVISDGLNANLPDLNPFVDADGKLRMASFLGHVSLRPRYWPALIRLGPATSAAARALARTVDDFLKNGAKA